MPTANYDAATPPLKLGDSSHDPTDSVATDDAPLNADESVPISEPTPASEPNDDKYNLGPLTATKPNIDIELERDAKRHFLQKSQTPTDKKKLLIFTSCVLLIVCCAAAGFYFYSQNNQSNRAYVATVSETASKPASNAAEASPTNPAQQAQPPASNTPAQSTEEQTHEINNAFISMVGNDFEEIIVDEVVEDPGSEQQNEAQASNTPAEQATEQAQEANPLASSLFSKPHSQQATAPRNHAPESFSLQAEALFIQAYNLQHSDKASALSALNSALDASDISAHQLNKISNLKDKLQSQLKVLEGIRG